MFLTASTLASQLGRGAWANEAWRWLGNAAAERPIADETAEREVMAWHGLECMGSVGHVEHVSHGVTECRGCVAPSIDAAMRKIATLRELKDAPIYNLRWRSGEDPGNGARLFWAGLWPKSGECQLFAYGSFDDQCSVALHGDFHAEAGSRVRDCRLYGVRPPAVREEGAYYVSVEFVVTETGSVGDPVVIEAEPQGLFERHAIDAALKLTFKPMMVDGRPVDVSGVRRTFRFEPESELSPFVESNLRNPDAYQKRAH